MQTLYALILSFHMEKISSLVIRILTHPSPKLKVSVLGLLRKVIETKAAYTSKKSEILGFLEEIKKSLFKLMSNANKQVRDTFFSFKAFLIKQDLMDEMPDLDRAKSRSKSFKKPRAKRTNSNIRALQSIRKKGASQIRRQIHRSGTTQKVSSKMGRSRSKVTRKQYSSRQKVHSKASKREC